VWVNDERQLVAIGVAHIGGVETIAILRAKTRCAFVASAAFQGEVMQGVDFFDIGELESGHGAIADGGLVTIEGVAYEVLGHVDIVRVTE
jgi:hypothetical protein